MDADKLLNSLVCGSSGAVLFALTMLTGACYIPKHALLKDKGQGK